MKKIGCIFVFFAFALFQVKAQQLQSLATPKQDNPPHQCGNNPNSATVNNDLQQRLAFRQQQQQKKNSITNNTLQASSATAYANPNVIFDVAVHIPFTSTIAESTVNAAFCNLNQKFAPVGIQFKISRFYYDGEVISNLTSGEVNGDNYYLAGYTIPNQINLYIPNTMPVDGISSWPFATTIAGNTIVPTSRIIVRANRFTIGNGSTLPHEFGHFFGLYHPDQNPNGYNCETQGDLVCDTPYDPGTRDENCYFDQNCNWVNNCNLPAPLPLGNNLMALVSNASAIEQVNCRTSFTQGQYDRIKETYYMYYNSFYNNLLRPNPWEAPAAIQGTNNLPCYPATARYDVINVIGADGLITWSSPSGNLIITPISGTGGQSVMVGRTANGGNGTVYLQATIVGNCQPLIKEIGGAIPDASKIEILPRPGFCDGSGTMLRNLIAYYNNRPLASYLAFNPANGAEGIDKVEWAVSGNPNATLLLSNLGISCGTPDNIICNGSTMMQTPALVSGQQGIIVSVRVRSQCSGLWSGWVHRPIVPIFCGGGGIYPCGRVGSFSVVAKTKDEKADVLTEMVGEQVDFEAKLYDTNGNVVKEGKSHGKHRIDWDTSDLKEGQYILRTEYKGEVKSQHVMVNSVCCGGGGGC